MWTRLRHLWEIITTGYWFVPTVMSIVAIVAAFVLLHLDRTDALPVDRAAWLYTGGADGAKTVLSTVASSVITVAGVAFSITIAALSQASSQFGPRLLRNFMRDTGNQVVLGTFVATFLFCLLVLRAIRGEFEGGQPFVPHASVTAAVLMAAASIAMLIYFIHHISVSLQAPVIVAAVAADLHAAIARFPEWPGEAGRGQRDADVEPAKAGRPVFARCDGYVQVIDEGGLLELARGHDLVLALAYRPGSHIIKGSVIARVWPPERFTDAIGDAVNEEFICGNRRTPEQDVEFSFRQLAEIAVRALSPGINDPFTAINCIDALGSALVHVSRRQLPEPYLADEDQRVRVVRPVTTFEGLVDASYQQIRQYGQTSVAVTIRLLEILTECARQMPEQDRQQALRRHAEMIYVGAKQVITGTGDLADVQERWDSFRHAASDA